MRRLINGSMPALALSAAVLFATAAASAAPPAPNIDVTPLQGNMTPTVESTYQYTTTVRNIGNRPADGVVVTFTFPATNTSPTKYILGKLIGPLPTGCTLAPQPNRSSFSCSLGTMAAGASRNFAFGFEFQVATISQAITVKATSTSTNERTPQNNQTTMTPALNYPDNIATTGTYFVSSCTGRGLTSYYECEISPSSIQSVLSLDLDSGGTLMVTGDPLHSGIWDQSTLINKSLHLNIPSSIDFNGFAVSSTCFEGITTFPSTTTYNSAYRICRQ